MCKKNERGVNAVDEARLVITTLVDDSSSRREMSMCLRRSAEMADEEKRGNMP